MRARKGFTLVEVIVVLVILAILAAIMIPAMTGWIDKANEKKCFSAMGMVARDYHACVAGTGYGLVTEVDPAVLAAEAIGDVTGQTVTGGSYACPAGRGTCTLNISADKLSVASIDCTEHGTMTFGAAPAQAVTYSNSGEAAVALAGFSSVAGMGNTAFYSGVDATIPQDFINELDLPANKGLKEYLDGKTWVINYTNKGPKVYICDNSLADVPVGTKISVIEYDPVNGTTAQKKAYVGTAKGTSIHTINTAYVF